MNPLNYSSPYFFDDPCPFSYGQIPPAMLPDLYYEYGLDASPSSSSSEIISTPPIIQTPLLPLSWDFMGPAYTHTPTCYPNNATRMDLTSHECPTMDNGPGAYISPHSAKTESLPHPMSHTQEIIDYPPTTAFVSPADTLLGSWAPIAAPLSQSSPKLYQPRPSRRIPIVDLDELASACESFHPRAQQSDRIRSEIHSPYPPYQCPGLFDPISEPIVKQGPSVTSQERVLLCSCGCTESYRLY